MKEKISILLIGFMLMFPAAESRMFRYITGTMKETMILTSKMKTDRQSENGFVRNFLETYNADMETKEELLDIAGIKMFSYKTSAENTVFVFQEPVPDSTDIKIHVFNKHGWSGKI